jgi:ATP-dependent helicase/nuclease subunit B
VITPRATRLVRAGDLQVFRDAAIALALEGPALDARDRLVIVPTRAAAAHLLRSIEDSLVGAGAAALLPDLITPGEIVERLVSRLDGDRVLLTPAEREVLLGVACRAAKDAGADPPFRLRPGLIAEILAFYDALRRQQKDVQTFERLALGLLEPGAAYDRGAERLVRQTRFLVAAFGEFERRSAAAGLDEHALRADLLATAAPRPYRHIVVTVGDRAFDPNGLTPVDWDLLSRLPGLERLDVLVTDRLLAGALHEKMHSLLPGIEEVRAEAGRAPGTPILRLGPGGAVVHSARDREEEVAGFARRVKSAARRGGGRSLERTALVVRQPLPYVYVGREVLRSAGIPCQLFDALPLAAEPYAAALDLVFSCVSSSFARVPAIALLRSPHFRFETTHGGPAAPRDVAALDRVLSEAGYLGEAEALSRLIESWRQSASESGRTSHALRAATVLSDAVQQLLPLRDPAPVAEHLSVLLRFLASRENLPAADDPMRSRHLRARGAIQGTLTVLRDAYRRFDPSPVDFDAVAALVRRWIEGQTFAPRSGDSGVHIVDAASAPFGNFDDVQLAGLVDGEWPDRPRRNIFYSTAILRELGWPAEADRLDGARAAFADLLQLPSTNVVASTFLLEADALVTPSPFVDELERSGLEASEEPQADVRVFDYEALSAEPVNAAGLPEGVRVWAQFRGGRPPADDSRYRGSTAAHAAIAYSLSALERYQDCPFKFFASDVLRLEEAPEDEPSLSPRARGRFIHEVFQQFFLAWDAQGHTAITPERVDAARAVFADVAAPLLARLPESDAALERTRLFGSAISVGIVDVVLGLEAGRPIQVEERWLEHRFEGVFSLGGDGRQIALKGVADRIDLLAGNRLRVIDYKTGYAPNSRRALQVPIYALCAQQQLGERDGRTWEIDEAAYVAFTGKRALVQVVKSGSADAGETLAAARARAFEVADGIAGGIFPPRPHDPMMCRYCAYASVCRKDYVGDE